MTPEIGSASARPHLALSRISNPCRSSQTTRSKPLRIEAQACDSGAEVSEIPSRAAKRGGFKRGGGLRSVLSRNPLGVHPTKESSGTITEHIARQGGSSVWPLRRAFLSSGARQDSQITKSKHRTNSANECSEQFNQGPLNKGGFKQGGGFPIWACPFFLSFSVIFPDFFGDFPDLSGDSPRIFPICPFPLSRPINSTYEEQSRKGPRHNLDLSRKKWETPRFRNPPV